MRGALARGALAITTMVALAFLIPLTMLVRQEARDAALSAAQRQAAAIGPVLAVTDDPDRIAAAMAAGAGRRMAVHLPDGRVVGSGRAPAADVLAARGRPAAIVDVPDGSAVLQPVVLGDAGVAVIEVFVPGAEQTRGLLPSWLILLSVAGGLVLTSVVVADRLASRVVRSVRRLADTATALGGGDLGVRADRDAPYELREVGAAFDLMAERLRALVDAERQFAGDVSHRLRTPLTALRLAVARLPADDAADAVRLGVAAVEQELDDVIRSARSGRDDTVARCDAAAVTGGRMTFWAELAGHQGRPVTTALPGGPAVVPLAAQEFVTVLDALVGNVVRHTPGGTALHVEVGTARGWVVLSVDDAGPGLPPSGPAAPDAGPAAGAAGAGSTGLGLDIVRRQAEAVGGRVELGRGPLGGARVRVVLPDWSTWRAWNAPAPRRRRPRGLRGLHSLPGLHGLPGLRGLLPLGGRRPPA